MANKVHVKTGDTVYILSGKDKGKKARSSLSNPTDMTVIVEGVNMSKSTGNREEGTRKAGSSQESPISSSKVMLVCGRCGSRPKSEKSFVRMARKTVYAKNAAR